VSLSQEILPCDMDINLTAGGDLDTNLHVGGDMDTVLGPDEVVLVLGCRLLLYVGMFKCILWYSSAVGLTKWIYTTKQGAEGFFFTLWKAFSRHQQHSPLRDVDSPHHLELRGVGIIVGQGKRFRQCGMSFLKEWARKN
jgi:hypothetical protein